MKWSRAWTGGQYSLVRAMVAATVALALVVSAFRARRFDLLPLVLATLAGAVAVGVGTLERFVTAIVAISVSLGAASGALGFAAGQYAAFWLSLHVLAPRAPYGSFAAADREDPRGDWEMPAWMPGATWTVFVVSRVVAAGHAHGSDERLLAFAFLFIAVLALFRFAALAAWTLSLLLGFLLACLGAGSFGALWLLHLMTLQPLWLPRRAEAGSASVFYDGSCALCHGAVRFLLAEDREPPVFRIAPIGSDAFLREIPEDVRRLLPDSVVVVRGGEIYARSAATLVILDGLGGLWWLLGKVLSWIPEDLLDRGYDAIAANRYRWFGRRAEACPLMPASLRGRIEA